MSHKQLKRSYGDGTLVESLIQQTGEDQYQTGDLAYKASHLIPTSQCVTKRQYLKNDVKEQRSLNMFIPLTWAMTKPRHLP